ncbi:6-bladed beta-propeller [candidate division KSB1 bacterium]
MQVKTVVVLLLFVVLLFSCGSDETAEYAVENKVIENVLKLELEFGADDNTLDSEYLLATPYSIAVTNENDILVFDEDCIKVFNEKGKPITLIGREGEGPGEFSGGSSWKIYISPSGYMSVLGGARFGINNVFAPDFSFVERKNYIFTPPYKGIFDRLQLRPRIPYYIYALNETDRIYLIEASEIDSKSSPMKYYLVMVRKFGETYSELVRDELHRIKKGSMTSTDPTLGYFNFALLPENKIVYYDTQTYDNNAKYNLIVLSLENLEKTTITYSYEPILFPEREIDSLRTLFGEMDGREYYPSLQRIMADNNFVFAFTNKTSIKDEIYVDIIDMKKYQYICSAYFPFIPDVIKNGYAYKLIRAWGDTFASIQKYRIDPAVYGK